MLTRSTDWEKDRAMDIDHPLYRALSSGRKRVNGEAFAVFLIWWFLRLTRYFWFDRHRSCSLVIRSSTLFRLTTLPLDSVSSMETQGTNHHCNCLSNLSIFKFDFESMKSDQGIIGRSCSRGIFLQPFDLSGSGKWLNNWLSMVKHRRHFNLNKITNPHVSCFPHIYVLR